MNDRVVFIHKSMRQKIKGMSLRERAFIVLSMALMIILVADFAVFQPALKKKKALKLNVDQVKEDYRVLAQEKSVLDITGAGGLRDKYMQERDKIQSDIDSINMKIEKSVSGFVSEKNMSSVLKDLMPKGSTVRIVGLSTIADDESNSKTHTLGGRSIHKHGMKIELEGSYFEIISYLAKLENLPWRLIWESIDYKVNEYPRAKVTLVVNTLSLSKEWLGV